MITLLWETKCYQIDTITIHITNFEQSTNITSAPRFLAHIKKKNRLKNVSSPFRRFFRVPCAQSSILDNSNETIHKFFCPTFSGLPDHPNSYCPSTLYKVCKERELIIRCRGSILGRIPSLWRDHNSVRQDLSTTHDECYSANLSLYRSRPISQDRRRVTNQSRRDPLDIKAHHLSRRSWVGSKRQVAKNSKESLIGMSSYRSLKTSSSTALFKM